MFQHTAARRRLDKLGGSRRVGVDVSTHSRPKAAGYLKDRETVRYLVSTHSRPKAAGTALRKTAQFCFCFNTQPPEGGWFITEKPSSICSVSTHSRPKAAGSTDSKPYWRFSCFNTQPPEGGWVSLYQTDSIQKSFQHTAARRRLAPKVTHWAALPLFQHTAARRRLARRTKETTFERTVSTHSRPKAAGR